MLGHGRAQAIALHLEYDWRPESNFARAALADRVLPQLERGPQLAVELARTAGDRDRWEIAWNVSQTSFDLPQIAAYVESWLKDDVGWRLISSDASADRSSARWSFEDGETARWQATSGIETADTDPRRYRVTLSIERSPGPAAGRAAVAGGG
ncbi:MAG TPA: hypothetical protein VD788_09500, partial [Candidatus Polarisedimenticolaceae bacterium]|nr:hypothetical protein [Candidatus Polarisedimenticolaceae bacterium]